jgi:hypothetical protein
MRMPWSARVEPKPTPQYEADEVHVAGDEDCDHVREYLWELYRPEWDNTSASRCIRCGELWVRSSRQVEP